MKLISLNIEHNLHDELVLPFLEREDLDIVCIQELLEEKLDFYRQKLQALGFGGTYQRMAYCTGPSHPELRGKPYGLAIFAKQIIASGATFFAGDEKNITGSFEEFDADQNIQNNAALLWVDVKDGDGTAVKVVTTHLPVTKNGAVTPLQLKIVDLLLENLPSLGEFVLCGDFNAPRGREAFDRIAKKYKDNIPGEHKTSIDQNLHRVKGIQFVVDGLFTTHLRRASNVRLVDGVSDHMAIIADIN